MTHKSIPLLLLLFPLFLFFALFSVSDGRHFPWFFQWPTHQHKQILQTINTCCPSEKNHPILCCAEQLFETGGDYPQKMCKNEESLATIFQVIKCAQRDFHQRTRGGHRSTDICRNFCCDLLAETNKETECSKTCRKAAFFVGYSVNEQLSELREMGCDAGWAARTKFDALEKCLKGPKRLISGSIGTNDERNEDDKMREVRKVCGGTTEDEEESTEEEEK